MTTHPDPASADTTVVITCMGRLEHLRQSLPRVLRQRGLRSVVVDYGCPQRCGEWVQDNHPDTLVVRAEEVHHFNAARARNLGARSASTEWLCFIDADTLIGPQFHAELQRTLADNTFLLLAPWQLSLTGVMVCQRSSFWRVGGYDELFEGWGSEDLDLYVRLVRSGCRQLPLTVPDTVSITHDDLLRTQYHALADRALSARINTLYLQIKTDLARLTDSIEIPLAHRQMVRSRLQELVLAHPSDVATFDITLPWTTDTPHPAGWQLRRTMQFALEPTPNP